MTVSVTVAKRMAAVVARGAREASVERAQWQRRTTRLDPKTRPCLPRTALPSPTRSCHAQAAGHGQALGRHAQGTGTPPTETTPMTATPRISSPPKTLRRTGFGLMLCSGAQSPGDCHDSGSCRRILVRGVVGVSGSCVDDGPVKSGSRPSATRSGALGGTRVASGVPGGSGSSLEAVDGSVNSRRGCARPSAS